MLTEEQRFTFDLKGYIVLPEASSSPISSIA